jgi:hypothetical protein
MFAKQKNIADRFRLARGNDPFLQSERLSESNQP